MSLGGGGGPMQEIREQLQALEQEKQIIRAEIQGLRQEQDEIDEAVEAIETLESGADVRVPVGGDASIPVEVGDMDEVVVGLGGGYAAERDSDGAIETLERKRDTIDDRVEELEAELEEVDEESEELEQRAQQAQQQQMQQMQQQLQDRDDE